MQKNTKIIIWTTVGLVVAVGAFFGIRSLIKKSREKKNVNITPVIPANKDELATMVNALDLIQKSQELDTKRREEALKKLAPGQALNFTPSYLGKMTEGSSSRKEYMNLFIANKVTTAEYNAVLKMISSFEKNETETIKKLTESEKELLRSFSNKIKTT